MSEAGTAYRTPYNTNDNAELFRQASKRIPPSHQRPLQISKGAIGIPPDPYPAASRITPATLHIDMGIMTYFLEMHNKYISLYHDHLYQSHKKQA